jgi:hypothetical protein
MLRLVFWSAVVGVIWYLVRRRALMATPTAGRLTTSDPALQAEVWALANDPMEVIGLGERIPVVIGRGS